MKGTLKKQNDKWYINYLDWSHQPTGEKDNYRKELTEFIIELNPSDANDANSLLNTSHTLDGKEVRFAFKEVNGKRYGVLKNPREVYPPDEVEQEMLMDSLDNCIKNSKYATASDIKFSNNIGHKCFVCETDIDWKNYQPLCDPCMKALKSLILEKRVNIK